MYLAAGTCSGGNYFLIAYSRQPSESRRFIDHLATLRYPTGYALPPITSLLDSNCSGRMTTRSTGSSRP